MTFYFFINRSLKPVRFESDKRPRYFSWVLVAFGLLAFVLAVTDFVVGARDISIAKVGAASALRESFRPKLNNQLEDPLKTEIVAKILHQRNYQWDKVFSILESTYTESIKIISVQPKIDKNEILITAQASNVHEMLTYVKLLGGQERVAQVQLLSQDESLENQLEKVDFIIMVKFF